MSDPAMGGDAAPRAARDTPNTRQSAFCGVPVAGLLVAVAAAALLLAVFWGRQVNDDIAWYLIATQDWLGGARLYVDIVEVNPPLNFYLTVPPVLLAGATGLTLPEAQFIAVAALLVLSVAWSARILARTPLLTPARQGAFLAGVAAALVVPALGAVGQREHLMLLFVTPWLIGELVADDSGRPAGAVARAAFAAAGICIKPFFLVYPVALTLWRMHRLQSFRPVIAPGNLVMAGLGAAYLCLVATLHPEYLADIVPVAMAVYGEYGQSSSQILTTMRPLLILLFLVAGLAAMQMGADAGRMSFWWAAVAAAVMAYLAQAAGFSYQAVPVFSLITMGYAWMLVTTWPAARPGVLAAAGLTATLAPFAVEGPFRNEASPVIAAAVAAQAPPEAAAPRLAVLSTMLMVGPPVAIEAGARWIGRYPALWLIPGALDGLARADCAADPALCARLAAIRDRTRRDIVTDLVEGRPDVIVVDTFHTLIDVPGFTWDGFLAEDPRYPAFRAGYDRADDLGGIVLLTRTGG